MSELAKGVLLLTIVGVGVQAIFAYPALWLYGAMGQTDFALVISLLAFSAVTIPVGAWLFVLGYMRWIE